MFNFIQVVLRFYFELNLRKVISDHKTKNPNGKTEKKDYEIRSINESMSQLFLKYFSVVNTRHQAIQFLG